MAYLITIGIGFSTENPSKFAIKRNNKNGEAAFVNRKMKLYQEC